MTVALPSILEAIFNPNLKSPGKSGSARLPRGMKLGSVRHLVLSLWWYPDPCITARSFDPARFNALAPYARVQR